MLLPDDQRREQLAAAAHALGIDTARDETRAIAVLLKEPHGLAQNFIRADVVPLAHTGDMTDAAKSADVIAFISSLAGVVGRLEANLLTVKNIVWRMLRNACDPPRRAHRRVTTEVVQAALAVVAKETLTPAMLYKGRLTQAVRETGRPIAHRAIRVWGSPTRLAFPTQANCVSIDAQSLLLCAQPVELILQLRVSVQRQRSGASKMRALGTLGLVLDTLGHAVRCPEIMSVAIHSLLVLHTCHAHGKQFREHVAVLLKEVAERVLEGSSEGDKAVAVLCDHVYAIAIAMLGGPTGGGNDPEAMRVLQLLLVDHFGLIKHEFERPSRTVALQADSPEVEVVPRFGALPLTAEEEYSRAVA